MAVAIAGKLLSGGGR